MVPWQLWITPDDEIYVCGSSPMHWGDDASFGMPPKDQVVMKFDPDGRVLEMWMFPKGEDGNEQPGDLNWRTASPWMPAAICTWETCRAGARSGSCGLKVNGTDGVLPLERPCRSERTCVTKSSAGTAPARRARLSDMA